MDTIVAGIEAAIYYRGDAEVKAKTEGGVKKSDSFLLVFDEGGLGEVFQRGDQVGGQGAVG